MKFTIDRFENDFVIVELENCEFIELPKEIIPEESKEGDILEIQVLSRETEDRRREIDEKFKKLLKK